MISHARQVNGLKITFIMYNIKNRLPVQIDKSASFLFLIFQSDDQNKLLLHLENQYYKTSIY